MLEEFYDKGSDADQPVSGGLLYYIAAGRHGLADEIFKRSFQRVSCCCCCWLFCNAWFVVFRPWPNRAAAAKVKV